MEGRMRSNTQIKNHDNTSLDSTPDQIKEMIESISSASDDEANIIYTHKRKISNLKV